MVYFLIEDTGSGYDFYTSVNRHIFKDKFKVVTSNGIGNMNRLIKNLKLKDGDIVILAADFNGDRIFLKIYSTLEMLKGKLDIKLIITNTYCFEEILLSSRILTEWIEFPDNIDYILDKIMSISDIRDRLTREDVLYMYGVLGYKEGVRVTLEKLLSDFLKHITKETPFKVSKGRISKCFSENCCYRDLLNNYPERGNINCNIYLKGRLRVENKLDLIISTSKLSKNVDLKYLKDIRNLSEYNMIYHKDLLLESKTMKEIISIHDSIDNKYEYGLDIFEIVYNYLNRQVSENSKGLKIKGF